MRVQVRTDRQLCTGIYRPSGSCHSAQQPLENSLSFHLCIYVYLYAKQVASSPHVAKFPLCTRCQYLWAIEEQEANFV